MKSGIFAVAVSAALFAAGHSVLADTITLHDLSQNTATGVYTYSIQLAAAANVQTGDGFVIYDFPGLTNFSITGGLSTSQFSLISTLTSNALSQSASVDTISSTAALINGITFDDPALANLSFKYVGAPVPFVGAATATLTLTSSALGGSNQSIYGSVDHSGSSPTHPFSFSTNPVTVPVPEPSSLILLSLSGLSLFGFCKRHFRS